MGRENVSNAKIDKSLAEDLDKLMEQAGLVGSRNALIEQVLREFVRSVKAPDLDQLPTVIDARRRLGKEKVDTSDPLAQIVADQQTILTQLQEQISELQKKK